MTNEKHFSLPEGFWKTLLLSFIAVALSLLIGSILPIIIIKALTIFIVLAFIIVQAFENSLAWSILLLISAGTLAGYFNQNIDPFSTIMFNIFMLISSILTIICYLGHKHPEWYKNS
jgi:uncharacterized membrane protein HdeD (DUF308 family)